MRWVTAIASLVVSCVVACGAEAPPAPQAPPTSRPVVTARPHPPASWDGPGHSTGTSYDDALAMPEDMSAVAGEPALSDVELSRPMRSPTFLNDCNVPETMRLMVQVAVRDGAAVGVTVRTQPDDASVAECIDKAVRALAWTASKRRDSLTTSY